MEKQQHSDVLIMGGGVIGVMCAYYLLKVGRSVRIIEKGEVGSGASHGNCGWACFSDIIPLCEPGMVTDTLKKMIRGKSALHIKPTVNFNLLNWFYRFAKNCNEGYLKKTIPRRYEVLNASKALFNTLLKEELINCDWELNGALMLCKEGASMDGYAETNELLKPFGLEAEPLNGKALVEKEPALREDLYGGWLHKTDAHLRPDKLIAEMKLVIQKQGAIIEEHCTVEKLELTGDTVSKVVTSKGDFVADTFVLAMGAWSGNFARQLQLKLPVQPAKGYSITTTKPSIQPKAICYFSEKHVVATPWQSGFRIGGLLSFSGFDLTLEKKRFDYLKAAAKAYLKVPYGNHIEEEWVGIRPMSCDDMPIIDRSPVHKNLILATGHSMLGVTMSPVTGKLVADLLTDKDLFMDPVIFSIQRFQ